MMTTTAPRLEREEQARARFVVTVDGATSNEQLLDPQFWSFATAEVQPGDRIIARRRRDEIEFVVDSVGPDGVEVRPLAPLPDEQTELQHLVICCKSDDEPHQYGASIWQPDGIFATTWHGQTDLQALVRQMLEGISGRENPTSDWRNLTITNRTVTELDGYAITRQPEPGGGLHNFGGTLLVFAPASRDQAADSWQIGTVQSLGDTLMPETRIHPREIGDWILTSVFHDGSQINPMRAPRWRDWHRPTAIAQTIIIRPTWSWGEITGETAPAEKHMDPPEITAAIEHKARLREARKSKDANTRVLQSQGFVYDPTRRSWMPPPE